MKYSNALLLLSFVMISSGTASAFTHPFYIKTNLTKAETCSTRFVKDAEKIPQRKELNQNIVETPINWNNFRNERQLFGYNPLFTPGRLSLAGNARPMMRDPNLKLQVLQDNGSWKIIDLFDIAKRALILRGITHWGPGRYSNKWFDESFNSETAVVFDKDCHVYTIINSMRSTLGYSILLHSPDGGESWGAYPLSAPNSPLIDYFASMESPSYGTKLEDTPVIALSLSYPRRMADNINSYDPRYPNKLAIVVPIKLADGTLSIPSPLTISNNSLYVATHSGGDNRIVSSGGKIFIAFPADQAQQDPVSGRWGTATYLVTYSRASGQKLEGPIRLGITFIGSAARDLNPNRMADEHNQAALAIGSDGILQVILSGHQARLQYLKAKSPLTIGFSLSDWTELQAPGFKAGDTFVTEVGTSTVIKEEHVKYTYASLKLDSYNQPVVLARWEGLSANFRLIQTYYSKSMNRWSSPQVLQNPGRTFYGVWHHKLTIDPWNRQYVSTNYMPDQLFVDEVQQFASVWGINPFSLTKVDPNCPDFTLQDFKDHVPGVIYCFYNGRPYVGPSLIMNQGFSKRFKLVTTDTFFE